MESSHQVCEGGRRLENPLQDRVVGNPSTLGEGKEERSCKEEERSLYETLLASAGTRRVRARARRRRMWR